jgi:hypothetical protein
MSPQGALAQVGDDDLGQVSIVSRMLKVCFKLSLLVEKWQTFAEASLESKLRRFLAYSLNTPNALSVFSSCTNIKAILQS